MIGYDQLAKKLKVSRAKIRGWILEGLPHETKGRKKLFDEARVYDWLIDAGYASDPKADNAGPVLNTRAECARHFGVTDRTVSTWQQDPQFPGEAGTPGKRDGNFPVKKIEAWLGNRKTVTGELDSINAQLKRERLRSLKLDNDEREGELVDLESVRRYVVRINHLARRELDTIEAEIPQLLPSDLDSVTVKEIRRKVSQRVEASCSILAGLLEKLED